MVGHLQIMACVVSHAIMVQTGSLLMSGRSPTSCEKPPTGVKMLPGEQPVGTSFAPRVKKIPKDNPFGAAKSQR